MAKSKHSPALFELIGQKTSPNADPKLAVPKWFRSEPSKPTPEPKPEPAREPSRTERPALQAASPPSPPKPAVVPPRPTSPAPSEGADESRPILQVRSGRLEISLNTVNAAVAAGVALLVIFSSFMIGQGVGRSSAPARTPMASAPDDAIETALAQPADSSILDVGSEKATLMGRLPPHPGIAQVAKESPAAVKPPSSGEGPPPGGWNRSLNYIVIQTFKQADRPAAEFIQRWLSKEYELETRLVSEGRNWVLITASGFDFSDPAERQASDHFITELKSLGDSCARELTRAGLPVYRLNAPFAKRFTD